MEVDKDTTGMMVMMEVDRLGLWSWMEVDKDTTGAVVMDKDGQVGAMVMDGGGQEQDRGCGYGWR